MPEPTYIFKNGHVYTLVNGEVVAKVVEAEFNPDDQGFVDPQQGGPDAGGVPMPDAPADIQDDLASQVATCEQCGNEAAPEDQFCSQCGSPIQGAAPEDPEAGGVPGADLYGQEPPVGAQAIAKNASVVTPNGLRGTVMGKHDLWGEEVTVRFENGVIKQLPASFVTAAAADDNVGNDPVAKFDAVLADTVDGADIEALRDRHNALDRLKSEARRELLHKDIETLDRITVQASLEQREINDALSHIGTEQEEAHTAFASIEDLPAVQQASMGGTDATWLDKTLGEMRASVEATNFQTLMDEGPEVFIAGLDDAQLADAGTVRHIASRWIRSHTAGADEELRDKYDSEWLARVEEERRQALSARKEEVRKEASSQESYDGPDDALFL